MSAPSVLVTLIGATTLPTDFDIFMPLASTVKPWVSTCLYGAWPCIAQEASNDEWNQPRC